MKQNKKIDILNGHLLKSIILFTIPIAVSSVLQQLFNSADTAVAGKFGSSNALAAVGTTGEIVALIVSISAGLSIGANVVISHLIGSEKNNEISQAISSVIKISIFSGLIIGITGQLPSSYLLKIINTPENIVHSASLYLRIYFIGVPFMVVYDFGAAILRASGNSQKPLNTLIISGVVNVLLNLFFVVFLKMDIAGVAAATDIANALSAALILIWLRKRNDVFKLTFNSAKINIKILENVLRIGVPSALQGGVFCIANIFIQAAVNKFGSDAAADSAIAMNYEYISYYIITAFGQTATTFISQNYAAKNLKRCKNTLIICLLSAFAGCSAITLPVTVFCRKASLLFSSSEAIIDNSCLRIAIIVVLVPICVLYEIPASAMRGYGISLLPAIEIILGICAFRIIWIFTIFKHFNSLKILYMAFPVSWVITSTIILITYFIEKRKINKTLR